MLKKIDFRKFFVRFSLTAIALSIVGVIIFDRQVRKYGYEGAGDFISNYWTNVNRVGVEPIHLNISIEEEDLQFIESKREEALERGVQINVGNNYVSCKLNSGTDEEVKGEIRLKGHMTDHLQGDKWSYRVKTEQPVLGMYRFSLQHPGTRNYAYEWVYHQLLKEEGIIFLNYDFIELSINDKNKGIYAIEEHFGQHVLARNNRPKGAILRWNPELYWEWRIDELNKVYLDEEYSSYSSSFPEPYDKGVVLKDPELVSTYEKGAALIEGFRRGALRAGEVFDLDLLAKFHAIIDLVGGYHSLDWSDIKFYYNSSTGLLEPVGYESFSVRKSEKLAGQRIPDGSFDQILDYHDKLFADHDFFRLYIGHLERIADEAYFNSFIQIIQDDLDKKLSILAKEWQFREFTFDPYFTNIDLIRHNLELPRPLHAFTDSLTEDSIYLSVAPVSDYPIEIFMVEQNDKEETKLNSFILPRKKRKTFARYYTIVIPNKAKKLKKLELHCRIPGSTNKFKLEVNKYPSFQRGFEAGTNSGETEISQVDDVAINDDLETYFFKESKVNISKPILIPRGAVLQISQGQTLQFADEGKLIVEGQLSIKGTSDSPVIVNAKDNWEMIHVKPSGIAEFNYVQADSIARFVEVTEGRCLIRNSVFTNISDELLIAHFGDVFFQNVTCGSIAGLGRFDRSKVRIENLTAMYGDTLLWSSGSYINMRASKIDGFNEFAYLDHISQINIWGSELIDIHTVADLTHASDLSIIASKIRNAETGFKVDFNSYLPGNSTYSILSTELNGVQKIEES